MSEINNADRNKFFLSRLKSSEQDSKIRFSDAAENSNWLFHFEVLSSFTHYLMLKGHFDFHPLISGLSHQFYRPSMPKISSL